MRLTIGVDIGGTKVLGGLVTPDGEVLTTSRRPTPSTDVRRIAEVITEVVLELAEGRDVEAVGVGAAGWIDAARSTVLFAPNLAWRDEPLRQRIEESVRLPVVVENDANAAAWAEYRFGAARGEPNVVLVTLGTGIGGGIVLDGRLYRGAFGMAAEFGHVRVVPGGRPCGCGDTGCWEMYASGKALAREARTLAEREPGAATALLGRVGGDPAAITGPAVTEAAGAGDPIAVEAFAIVGHWLGQGLADIASAWDPGRIVLGGGVAEAGDLLEAPTRSAYRAALVSRGILPVADIHIAVLGNTAGLVGAADLARTR